MWQTGLLNELVWRLYHMGPIERNSSNPDNEDDTEIILDKHNWQKLNDDVSKEMRKGLLEWTSKRPSFTKCDDYTRKNFTLCSRPTCI